MKKSNITDHLYGFASWLTTREEKITACSSCNASPMAEAVNEYIKANDLPNVSKNYPKTFTSPSNGKL
jgi:hypothetical protein